MMDFITEKLAGITGHTELRTQTAYGRRAAVLNGNLVGNSSTKVTGVGARVYNNGVWGFASISAFDKDSVARVLRSADENAALLNSKKPKNKGALTVPKPVKFVCPRPFQDTDQKTLTDFAMALDGYIKEKYPSLTSRSVGVTANCIEKTLYTNEGTYAFQLFPRTYVAVAMAAETSDGDTVELFDICGGGEGYFADYYDDPSKLYEKIDVLYEQLMQKKEGVFPDAGERLCVIDSAISGMIAHEAVGHTVEADLVLSGSVAAGAIGTQVASPLVNLVDFANTALGEKAPLPVYVDDEGTECTDSVLIKDGILTGYMNNLESARHFGVTPCGNARAYSYSDEPLVRMRNTAILPGKDKLEDMISSVDDGYYLLRTQNGQADTTGEFMFGITMGYEIKNGILARALRDTTISGVAFNMLKTVDMLSDTIAWDIAGYCGKKQPMPVSMGGPAVRCTVNIGGR